MQGQNLTVTLLPFSGTVFCAELYVVMLRATPLKFWHSYHFYQADEPNLRILAGDTTPNTPPSLCDTKVLLNRHLLPPLRRNVSSDRLPGDTLV